MHPTPVPHTFDWLTQTAPELAAWLREMSTYLVAEAICEISQIGETICVNLYSETNIYHLNCRPGERGFLGLTFSRRTDGAGNDLADGPYTRNTWDRIIRDILSCELISLKRVANPSHHD